MDKLLDFLKDEDLFVRWLTLLAGIIAILFIESGLDGFVKDLLTQGYWRRVIPYGLFELIFIGVWWFKRYVFPRVPKGKIGLIIAVTTESAKARIRLRVDLAEKLKETIGTTPLHNIV